MAVRLLGSLFAVLLLAACAQTEAPEPGGDAMAEAPPPAMPESDAMAEEKASMEATMSGESAMAEPMAEAPMAEEPMAEEPMAEAPMGATMPGSYTVFFDFNSAILTAEAESVIDQAAEAAATKGAASIGVTGFADAFGSSTQNETMSRWRAQAVADELVFRGIPPTALDVSWVGTATGATDRDESSRRVEIDVR